MSVATDGRVRSAVGLLSAWIESQRAYSGVPGLSIGVVHDQALVWSAGFGRASVEPARPATPDTLYRIASITKLFTSTAILQLRDAGKLRLVDPLVEHLPWFHIKQAHADAPAITIRHLLTHTAGLPTRGRVPVLGRRRVSDGPPGARAAGRAADGAAGGDGVEVLQPRHAFRSETRNGFGTNAEPVVFDVDGAGHVRRLTIGENSLEPVAQW
jgi:CubicO group peptidase (beta-lactamase class C family)